MANFVYAPGQNGTWAIDSAYGRLYRDPPVRSGLLGGPEKKEFQRFLEKCRADPKNEVHLESEDVRIPFISKTGHLSILS